MKGNEYGFFFAATFRFLKSMQIFNLPFFLGTTTMGCSCLYILNEFNYKQLIYILFDYCSIVWI